MSSTRPSLPNTCCRSCLPRWAGDTAGLQASIKSVPLKYTGAGGYFLLSSWSPSIDSNPTLFIRIASLSSEFYGGKRSQKNSDRIISVKRKFSETVFPMLSPLFFFKKKVTYQNRDWAPAVRLILPVLLWQILNATWQLIHHCFVADQELLEIRATGAEFLETEIQIVTIIR